MSVTSERKRLVSATLRSLRQWGHATHDIVAIALVGSWAQGGATMASDLDIVVITERVDHYIDSNHWVIDAVGQPSLIVRTKPWGVLTERRLQLESGFEIDMGFVPPLWAELDPVDRGTAAVITEGCVRVFDPADLVRDLIDAVHNC